MAIISIGTDIVQIPRIAAMLASKSRQSLTRIFTATELAGADNIKLPKIKAAHLAKRFAAKEALAKAVGTGIVTPFNFKAIGVINAPSGQPQFQLAPAATKFITQQLGPDLNIHLTLADDYPVATAVVIISSDYSKFS